MRTRSFKQVDVFTLIPYQGNPVAVVMEGEGLTTEQMQQIARWARLSETTFVLPPSDANADYRVRIFTPDKELPFAGHPTLATAHALLESEKIQMHDGILVQQCAGGLITLDIEYIGEDFSLYFTLPSAKTLPISQSLRVALMKALGNVEIGAARLINVGPTWITLQLENAEYVQTLKPDMAVLAELSQKTQATGITVFGEHPFGAESAFEVRSFAPITGVPENHVSASSHGCVAWIARKEGLISGNAYTASQGSCTAHNGIVNILYQPDGQILVGGHSTTCIQGVIYA